MNTDDSTGSWPLSEVATPFLVFADDWGRHPSSCQHLVSQMLGSREVVWVNTIGTRPPRLDLDTVRRGWEKARQWLRASPAGPQLTPANPRVLNPRMWPWFSSGLDRRLNRRLLSRQLGPIVRGLAAPPVAITTLPIVADLIDAIPVERWVYYCVDDFSLWPGLDGVAMRRLAARLLPRVDEVIAVSDTLRDRLAAMTDRPVRLLTHGVDLEFWAGDADESIEGLTGLEQPLILFWGITDRRMDVDFVRRLAADLTRGTIVLVGPLNNPDPAVLKLPRVVHLGPQPFDRLPALARAAAVLVMPYADLPVTRAMQPLKLKEYLATGRPVVVRDLPATREWSDALDLADTPAAFSDAVRRRIESGVPSGQRAARERLDDESWEAKAREFEHWIGGPQAAAIA
jgi:glycosyltransferase involved in cell wall biosynthesis